MGTNVCLSVPPRGFANLTDFSLDDQPSNSILTDDATMAIQGNVEMQMTQDPSWRTTLEPMFVAPTDNQF